jgi:two-component system, chemotaxis family, protein-glutamate methylesterase/glutaminase
VTAVQPRSAQTRALVVAVSAADRAVVVRILQADGGIVVVGQAGAGVEAVQLVTELRPDIVVLDLDLPGADGVQAIEQIMAHAPTPVLVLSHPGEDRHSPAVVEALAAGALDVSPRQVTWTAVTEARLCRSVRLSSKVPVTTHRPGNSPRGTPQPSRSAGPPGRQVVAVAASTGGPSVLATVLSGLAGLIAPVLVVQHLHQDFTGGFVEWMSRVSALPVSVAEHAQVPRSGHVYIAPGGTHLRLVAGLRLELDPAPNTLHRPSADELFCSVAQHAGAAAIGVVLTGMGDDGARGLLAIRQKGGLTLGQDEQTCAVFGMPAAARRLGAVSDMLPPAELARAICRADRSAGR